MHFSKKATFRKQFEQNCEIQQPKKKETRTNVDLFERANILSKKPARKIGSKITR